MIPAERTVEWTAPAMGWYLRTYDSDCYRFVAANAAALVEWLRANDPGTLRELVATVLVHSPEEVAEEILGGDIAAVMDCIILEGLVGRCPRADAVLAGADIEWMYAGKEMVCPVPDGGSAGGLAVNNIFDPSYFKNDARHIREVIERATPGFGRNVFFGTHLVDSVSMPALTAIAEAIVGYNEDQERNGCDQFIIPDTGENALVDDLAERILKAIEYSKDGYAEEVYGVWMVWTGNRYPLPHGEWWSEDVYDVLYAAMFGGEDPDGSEDREEYIDWAVEEVDWSEGETVGDHWVTEKELREMLGEVFDEAQRREAERRGQRWRRPTSWRRSCASTPG